MLLLFSLLSFWLSFILLSLLPLFFFFPALLKDLLPFYFCFLLFFSSFRPFGKEGGSGEEGNVLPAGVGWSVVD